MNWPRRFREQPDDALFRRLGQNSGLRAEDHARIREHLALVRAAEQVRKPSALSLLLPLVAAVAIGAIAWSSIGHLRPVAAPPTVRQPEIVSAPACGVSRISRNGFDIALVGPGLAVVVENEIDLRQGRLEIDTQASPVVVKTTRGRASIPPRSRAEVDIHDIAAPRVAAFAAGIEWDGTPLPSGTEWRPTGVVTVGSNAAEQAHAFLQGQAPSCVADSSSAPLAPEPAPAHRAPVRVAVEPPSADAPLTRTPAPQPASSSELAEQTKLFGQAVAASRAGHPDEALALLDQYSGRFARGAFGAEATTLRANAELALGHADRALSVLDRSVIAELPQAREMAGLRGWLRASAGRCRDALSDFTFALASRLSDDDTERALYGMATCRAQTGDAAGSRADFERYLERFPSGRFAADARRALTP